MASTRTSRNLLLTTPLIVLVPVSFGLLLIVVWDASLIWAWVGLGALGWTLALTLRAPLALTIHRVSDSPTVLERWTILLSGPLEESVRVGTLAIAGSTFVPAYSIGLGWGGIEAVYALVSGYAAFALMRGTGTQATQAREQLRQIGLLSPTPPFLGLLERVSASMLHIGFALLLAKWPTLVFVIAVLHSGLNLAALAVTRRNPFVAQLLLVGVSIVLFLAGLAAFGQV